MGDGEMTMGNELLEARIDRLEAGTPFSAAEIEAMSQTFSISVRRRYGLARLCLYWRVSRATLHRHLSAANRPDAPRRRRGPQGAMPDADLAERIRTLLADSPFHGEG